MGAWRSSTRALLWLAGVVCFGLLACPASFAANQTVTVGSGGALTFSPSGVSINAGESVTWNSATATLHNVTCSSVTPSSGAPAISCWSSSGDFVNGDSKDPFVLPNSSNSTYFQKSGTYNYQCTRHAGMTGTVTVNPGVLHHFEVVASATGTAGTSFSVSVTARDAFNNKVSFSGSVSLSISSPHSSGGEIPATTSLSAGTGSFNVTPKRSGSRTITVTSGSITGTDTVSVSPAAVHHLALTAPGTVNSGVNFTATVTGQDQFNNTVTSYEATIQITSGDSAAVLPAAAALVDGTRGFTVKLLTPGVQTVTATDTTNPALTVARTVNVNAACSVTFSNPALITINDLTSALPYPSNITVAGLRQKVTDLAVTITGLTHTLAQDVDILLVAPGGQKMIILSDITGAVSNATITLKDSAPTALPSPMVSGTFRPTNNGIGIADPFVSPAPAAPYASPAPAGSATLAATNGTFEGVDPNGTWSLYVVDDVGFGTGSISGGWSLTFDPGPNTFCNNQNISIPSVGSATPYPSEVEVSGLDGTVKDFSLRLVRLTHTFPRDVDVLVVGPQGQKMIAMADAGGSGASNLIIDLHASGATQLPATPTVLISGIFRPTNIDDSGVEDDTFPSPAPGAPYANPGPDAGGTATFASTFGGTDPNGIWKLFVRDDLSGGAGNLAGGWALSFDLVYNTETALTSSVNPSTFGQAITLRAIVSSSTPATGTISFMDGATVLATRTLDSGAASFSTAALSGGFHFITAIYSGDPDHHPSTSNLVIQRVNPRATTTTLTLPLSSSSFGQPVNFSATVTSAIGSPTGTVTFQSVEAGVPGAVPTVIGSATLSGAPPTATISEPLPKGGSQVVVAVYNGSLNHTTSTSPSSPHTVSPAATSTALTSSANPSTFGSPASITANVTSTAGVPIGSVVFKEGAVTVATIPLDDSGIAELAITNFTPGTRAMTAVFNATAEFGISSSAVLNQVVNKATPSVLIISFQDHTTFGDEAIFRADVTTSLTTKPTGTVTFKNGSEPLDTVTLDVPSGTATFSTTALGGGSHNITGTYDGDANFGINQSPIVVQLVDPAATAVMLNSSPNPSSFGQPVTFTATVSSAAGTSTGTVTFMDGATPLGSGTLNRSGVASFVTPTLIAGAHSITAVYGGSTNFAGSTSTPPLIQNVGLSATTVVLTASKDKSIFREAITFTVKVTSTSSGIPTGEVAFFDGDIELAIASLDGVGEASITLTNLMVGRRVITVGYRGDQNFPPNSSAPIVHYRSPKPRGQP